MRRVLGSLFLDQIKAGDCDGSTKPCQKLERKTANGKFNKMSSVRSNQMAQPSALLQSSLWHPETALLFMCRRVGPKSGLGEGGGGVGSAAGVTSICRRKELA